MNEPESTEVASIKAEVEEFEDSSIGDIPFELFEKQGNRTTKLVATSGEARPIDGRRRWHDFRFKEPVLVTRVLVSVSGYSEFNEFEFVWETETGKERRANAKPQNDLITFSVNDICRAISFRPPSRFFSQTQIHGVQIEGIKRDDVQGALDSLSHLETLKQGIFDVADRVIAKADRKIEEAAKADEQRNVLTREIATLKQSAARTKKTVEDLALKKNELIAENGEASRDLESATGRHKQLQEKSQLLSKENQELATKIQAAKSELAALKNNINLFPTEIVEFVNQGSKNIRQYFWLALIPIIIIGVMFFMLVNGAADLTTVRTRDPNINIEALLLSRVPYVTIALAVITACYKIARAFFHEMIRINSQRLNLTKISIIAKDVSSASEHELNLTEEDRYRLRTELKMNLLREHLKDYISKDYRIELPNRIVAALGMGEGKVKLVNDKKEAES